MIKAKWFWAIHIAILLTIKNISAQSSQDTSISIRTIEILSIKDNSRKLFKNDLFVANALQNQSSQFYIKNYGLGQLSTISYQGQSAENTTILWEKLPINSIMNGVFDLNLISSNNSVNFSQNNNSFGSAGTINISANNTSKNQLEIQSQLLSNHLYSNSIFMVLNLEKTRLTINNHYIFGDNNYLFIDQFGAQKNQTNNAIAQLNSQISLTTKLTKGEISSGFWIVNSRKLIPPTMTSDISGQEIVDYNLKGYVGYETKKVDFKVSIHSENQKYNDTIYNIHNTNQCISLLNYWYMKPFHFLTTDIDFTQYFNYYSTQSTNYNEVFSMFQNTNLLQIKKTVFSNSYISLNLKQLNSSSTISYPLPSFKINTEWDKKIKSTIQIEWNKRWPTMNEMHWNPGGNQNLLPESIFQIKSTISYNRKQHNDAISVAIEPFYSNINNGIKWLPDSKNALIWTPINIQNTENYGMLVEAEWVRKWNTIVKTRLHTSNQYIHSKINGLYSNIYTPNFKNTTQISFFINKIELNLSQNFTSLRYTNVENTNYLKEYLLFNALISYPIAFHDNQLKLSIGVNNIQNISYQEIENRALPMRYFFLQINLNLKNHP